MSQKTRIFLKTYFETGDKPTEDEFIDLIDSQFNLTDDDITDYIDEADSTHTGLLTSEDWILFNDKQEALPDYSGSEIKYLAKQNDIFTFETIDVDLSGIEAELDRRSITGHTHAEYRSTGTTVSYADVFDERYGNFLTSDVDYFEEQIQQIKIDRSLTGHTHVKADITDLNESLTNVIQTLTSSTNITWDFSIGNIGLLTLNHNATLNITNPINGETGILILTQGTGGNKLINTWPSTSKFLDNTNTLSTFESSIDILTFIYISGIFYWNLGKGYQ